ncbi:guanitoxin biosynthesis L-enduracididine beta-hydroxylase GntD [Streptomyces erythrochromogenes]|uniref:guanitoxin biosynthesis L-enduracididine beta-hydroxylase GntD n=1 Tax=Streptomyces erythrochromogenes TaxID=285574 RepID=UPI003865D592|nr:TauD/TfdA family dioxygenase [Streptomyces erythrochromogenes]
MEKYHLNAQANADIDDLVRELTRDLSSVHDAAFHRKAALLAHELPRELREALVGFRLTEPSGGFLLSGIRIGDAIGPTPGHWHQPEGEVSAALREEAVFVLCGQLLGDPFGYATLHNGLLMHNIVPIKGHEKEQISSGSEELLEWHTEEAFHPYRSDYTALMCLRNPYGAPTTYAEISDLEINEEDREVLRQPLFATRPSGSHSAERNAYTTHLPENRHAGARESFDRIEELHRNPPAVSILFGDDTDPYLCVDPDCMTPLTGEAAGALERLCAEINRKIQDIALAPGDILFLDNHSAIHGRRPFKARFDGSDRWLKRMNITRDLRRSRTRRLSADGRVIQ